MKRLRELACVVPLLMLVSASGAHAYDSWFERIGSDRALLKLFPASESKAEVHDGFLLGTGTETLRPLPDGRLQIERTRVYTRVRDTENGRIATLPEPWRARSVLTVLPSLRLVAADTQLWFKRSGDGVFPGQSLSKKHDWLFEVDRTRMIAAADGRHLTYETYRSGKRLKSERYDYPADAVPFELIGMFLSVAVARHLDRFDFELLVPGGSTHGVRVETHVTRDLRKFAAGYQVPKVRLTTAEPVALLDLHLASPVKYLFFPHHFYMAFSTREPWKLTMLWGGDPDENLQAFRID
jgi:hypothetical protein